MTGRLPYRPHWDANRVIAAFCLALLPPLAVGIATRGPAVAAPLALAFALAVAWPLLFARLRRRAMTYHSVVPAAVFVLLLPASVPLWQQGLAISFGLVMGDLIFGGRGRGFLNPVVVGLAFLLFSYPATSLPPLAPSMAFAATASGVVLLAFGLLSWRVVAGVGLGIGVGIALLSGTADLAALRSATLILGVVFLIGDPVAGASTNAGRWAYGALAGGLIALLGEAGGGMGMLDTVVFAALLSSLFAPLIDQVVIAANVRKRARRQSHD